MAEKQGADPMTPKRIAEIRAREQAATKGPWVVRPEEFDSWGWIRATCDGHFVANCDIGGRGEWKEGQPTMVFIALRKRSKASGPSCISA